MLFYTLRRVLAIIPLIWAVATVTFFLMHSVQGGPFDQDRPLSPAARENLEERYGLSDPLPVQYVKYLKGIVTGDLGISFANNRDVADIIRERMQISVQLGIAAFAFATILGLGLGTLSALNQNGIGDYVGVFLATAGAALPSFVLAPLLVMAFALELPWAHSVTSAIKLPWFNVLSGEYAIWPLFRGDFGHWREVPLPTMALGFLPMAFIARITRASMLDVLRQDYIRTARAKGVNEYRVVLQHAAKNAMIPVLTVLGPIFAGLIVGSFIIETSFAIPGLGQEFIRAVLIRDYGLIMGTTLFFTAIIAVMNLLVDLAYGVADPRIRF